ncbi:MAG TPA: ornithine cyclodeaminase family protein [Bryobacteraceae bacterium]|jgi:ornithine cyclodeaminase|nr:ornithine cyclodeaminase family protein [Bryobacteraceae bacterium]
MTLCLSEADVRAVLSMADLTGAMETALAAFSAGRVVQPVRTVVEMGDAAFFAAMPGFLREPAVLGAKLVAVMGANQARGLPTHRAAILLLDPETGGLVALMDGRLITEMRTAAVSAVSAKYMARADAGVLAILGSGVQARSHLAALTAERRFREVRAWSPTPAHLRQFAAESDVPVSACPDAAEAVRGADIVVLATASVAPVIEDSWVTPGAHVVSVGACRPTHREMDPALVARARLVVDSRASAFAESGDIVLGLREGRFAPDHVVAELGEVISGRVPGRVAEAEITVFKSLGLAVEDLAAADLVYQRARELGKGIEIDLGG